jgi:hypothetical protein
MTVRDEHGSAAIETVVIGPALILFVLLVALGGRLALAHQAVNSVAAAAARAASLERTSASARESAERVAEAGLAQQVPCQSHRLDLDLTGFSKRVGTPAVVTATLVCELPASHLGLPGVGTYAIGSTATNPLDTYRERAR